MLWCVLLFSALQVSSQTLDDFPSIRSLVDQANCCTNETVTLYNQGDVQFFYLANDADCFGEGGRLFLADGTMYCKDGSIDCRQFYGLTGGQVIYTCSSPSQVDLFAQFPFLDNLVDRDNCQGEVIEYFRNQSNNEFLCVVTESTRTWYYPDGTFACQSSGDFDCPTLYNFGEMELVDVFVCDGQNGGQTGAPTGTVGAVYAMTNGQGQVDGIVQGPNAVVAYAQAEDGTLTLMGEFPTGGNGGDFDGGEGLDPLISAYAITKSNDNQYVMAVNAGSNSVTSMRVNPDYTLTVVDTESTIDVGPNSIAYVPSRNGGENGIVYVSNISQPEFLGLGEPGQQGSIVGYRLLNDGSLEPIPGSRRTLANRPSAVQISPDGDFLVVASINAGAAALGSGSQDEIVVYGVNADGTLSDAQLSGATSTLRGNAEGRNLPSAIGFQIVDENIVVVTEAREFDSEGNPPRFPFLQDGSVSTWQIDNDGNLIPINLDVASGVNNTGRTACWLDFSDANTFFVSNAIEAGLASYSFNNGEIELLNQVAAQGTGATGNTTDPAAAFGTTEGWIDLWISDDGQYLYQCYGLTGEVGVYAIDGAELTLIQEIGGLPQNNVQGIVSVGTLPDPNEVTATYRLTFDALWSNTSHPNDFPLDEPNEARWSPVAGLTHNSSVRLFNEGDIASPGLVEISQSGSRNPIDSELAGVLASGAGEFYIESATRVRPSPGTISTTFDVTSSHPLLSLTSMIAPSPDWIVALRDFNLLENGEFIESAVVEFIPYDTGSDSGETFRSDNEDTQPRQPITRITDGVLAGEDGSIRNLGFWRLERIDAGSSCDVDGGTLAGANVTFDSVNDGVADRLSDGSVSLSGQSGSNNQFVVTDADGNILVLPNTPSDVDFDVPPPGLCYVYNVAYEGAITGLEVGNHLSDLAGCFDLSNEIYVNRIAGSAATGPAVGAVYAMTNGQGQVDGIVQGPNSVVAYAQAEDGTLSIIGSYPTGGNGGDFDGGEGLDPLISAYAITKSLDNRFVFAVNAGSNTVTSMSVNDDFSLTVNDTESTLDVGPNSIAYTPSDLDGVNGLIYVSNITQEEFLALGEPGQQGSIVGFWVLDDGSLQPVEGSRRTLANRPSAIQFSPAGDYVVVASINSGAAALGSGSEDEIVLYSVNGDGTLSAGQLDGATSTLRGNTAGRNLPSAIGFQIVGDNYVVVTEAREFDSEGNPPRFPFLQDGSVSTWQIVGNQFIPVDLDVASGVNNTGRTACWLDFSDENTFFVSNAIEAGLASYSFDNGDIELLNQVAAQGTGATGNTTDPAAAFSTTEGWIDLWISDDGQYLYQCYGLTGEVGVYAINGTELTLIQEIGGLPQNNVQGIVSVGQPSGRDTGDMICDVDGGVLSGGPFEFCVGDDIAHTIEASEIGLSGVSTGQAVAVQFEFEVLQPADGYFVTEPWVGLHNGSFDLFNFGERATPGLESLAEGGNTELLGSEFAQGGRLQATIGNGEVQFISPGETISGSIDIRNPQAYRYASFATMIIPSNDGFFGNENPLEFEVFDENGNYNGPIEIVLTGADLWDAGTEVNNASGAAGFSQGFDGSGSGPSTDDPSSTIGAHPGLDNIIGIQTAAGTTIGSDGGGALDADEPILRIRITVGEAINTVQAVGPSFEGSVVEETTADDDMAAVQFEFEVIQPTDGYFVTEPWVGLHDGSFDLFNIGDRATPGLESIAEGGNTELLGSEFAQAGRLQATIGNGQVQFISPGETISGSIDVRNPLAYRYASFATMIIPSNDGFFGNENPLEFEIFDENGNFNGPIEIILTGADLWDAGTEVNNASGAAGFSRGFDGSGSGPSTDDPSSTVGAHPGLDNIVGLQTAAGTTIGSNGGGALASDEPILRIRISLGAPINTVQAVGPRFEGSVVQPSEGWIVADATSGDIIGLPASISDFDFNSGSASVSNVFYYASEGDVTGLEVGGNLNDITGCFDLSNAVEVSTVSCADAVGAVYAMTNGEGQIDGIVQGPNSVVAYAQAEDGTLTEIGSFPTGGNGGDFDGGEGLDPLISAYAITKSLDNRFVFAVNAGSNTVTSMSVNSDYSLTVNDTESTLDIGPNSIAYTPSNIDGVNGLIYVSNITQEEFLALGEPGQQGSIVGFWVLDDGSLQPVEGSRRTLANRPSAIQFSPAGDYVVVASINSGAAALGSGSEDEIVLYSVNGDGTLSADQLAGATSTLRGNAAGRNLPSAIGFQIVGDNYVVVTEAREFDSEGNPPRFPFLQDGSVSTWQIVGDSFVPIDLDVASGVNNTGRTACWLDFSDENTFFVSNAIEAGLASYSFDNGNIELLNQVAAQGTGATGNTTDPAAAFGTTEGWIDLWISDDGQYLYQCYGLTGEVGVYAIDGTELTLIQEVGGLPQNNVQGIVSVGQITDNTVAAPVGAVYAMSNGEGQVEGIVQGPNSVVAYAQAADGSLTPIGEYATGGNGGDFDGGEGLDPLISAYAITKTNDNRFVLAVNAGSNTVTSMIVNDDFSLSVADTESTIDIGPNSIAYTPSDRDGINGIIYVSNITREEFLSAGEPGQQGSILGYWLLDDGSLQPIEGSRRELANRPSAIQFSPAGDYVVVASINAGAAALASGSQDEIVLYGVNDNGTLTEDQLDGATSTIRNNAARRNLPSAIGFQIVGDNYVVVTEAREFDSEGNPPRFPFLQDGSVSTWQIVDNEFVAIDLGVASGVNNTGRTACWLDFSDENTFFVSNAIEAGLASYSFNDGRIELLNQVAAQGTGATGNTTDPAAAFATTEGWIDLWISDDGQYLYQCYGLTGEVGVFAIDGEELTLIQEIGGLPTNNVQGIVSVGIPGETASIFDEDEFTSSFTTGDDLTAFNRASEVESIFSDLSVFPNPSSGEELNVVFRLNSTSAYTISLFRADGASTIQRSVNISERTAGFYSERMNVSGLANGVYIVELNDGSSVMREKLIIAK